MEKITNLEISQFLKDVLQNSEMEILEEAKEESELIEIAKARGINLQGNTDLAMFKSNFMWADEANANGARISKEKLIKALPTLIGKPIDVDHVRNHVVGSVLDFRYKKDEGKVVLYGAFYKSNFAELWDEAKRLFKEKKLSMSYECWCPKDKRTTNPDGTYNLDQVEFAGAALLFKETPAFADAKVLELAKKQNDLVFASKYHCHDLITASGKVPCANCKACQEKAAVVAEIAPTPAINAPVQVKCQNCGTLLNNNIGEIRCTGCSAIVDSTGKMLYPPQIMDFRVSCPDCSTNNWLLKSQTEDKAIVKCKNCTKEYSLEFKKHVKTLAEDFNFLYAAKVSCIQCGNQFEVSGVSSVKERQVSCSKCGLNFAFTIGKDKHKMINKIDKIEEPTVIDVEPIKSSEEGGKNIMDMFIEFSKWGRRMRRRPSDAVPGTLGAVLDEEMQKWCDEQEMQDEHEVDGQEDLLDEVEDEESKCKKVVSQAVEAKRLSYQEKKALSDKDFALVMRVKNPSTGKIRKIRKYAINDEAHVRNALARLGQGPSQKGLEKLGVSVEKVKRNVLKRARALKMDALLQRHEKAAVVVEPVIVPEAVVVEAPVVVAAEVVAVPEVAKVEEVKPVEEKVEAVVEPKVEVASELPKPMGPLPVVEIPKVEPVVEVAKEVVKSREEILLVGLQTLAKKYAELHKSSKVEVAFYKANAQEILKRRNELGDLAVAMKDEEVLNDDKYARVLAEKELQMVKAKLEKSTPDIVGSKVDDTERFARLRKEIDDKATGKVRREQ